MRLRRAALTMLVTAVMLGAVASARAQEAGGAAAGPEEARLRLEEVERKLRDQRLRMRALELKRREHERTIDDASSFLERKRSDRDYYDHVVTKIAEEIKRAEALRKREKENLEKREALLAGRLNRLASLGAFLPRETSGRASLRMGAGAVLARCRQLSAQVRVERQALDVAEKALRDLYNTRARYGTFVAMARGGSDAVESHIERRRESLARIANLKRHSAEAIMSLRDEQRRLNDLVSDLKQRFGPADADAETSSQLARTAVPSDVEPVSHARVFIAEPGAPVLAADGGLVWYAGTLTGYGRLVILRHGDGVISVYGQLGEILVRPGINVYSGQEVGRVGLVNNGGQTGVRFEIRRIVNEDQTIPLDSWPPTRNDPRSAILGDARRSEDEP